MKTSLLVFGFFVLAIAVSVAKAQNSTFVFLEKGLNVTLNNASLSASNATSMDLSWRNMTHTDNRNATNNATLGLLLKSTGNFSGNQTLLLGAAYTRSSNETVRHLPVSVLSYFIKSNSSCFSVPNKTLDNWSTNTSRASVASFVYGLSELAPNGTLIRAWQFNSLNWTRTTLNTTAADNATLVAAEWTANLTIANISLTNTTNNVTTTNTSRTYGKVYMAFTQSSILGVLNVFDTPMMPKAWNTIFRVANYNYTGTNNTLQIEVMAITGSEANTTAVNGSLFLESDAKPVGANLYDEAYVVLSHASWVNQTSWAPGTTLNTTQLTNGTFPANLTTTANATAWTEFTNQTTDPDQYNATLPTFLPIIYEQMEMRYGSVENASTLSNVSLYFANVTFAPASTNITYSFTTAIGRLLFTTNGTLETFGVANATNSTSSSFKPVSTVTSAATSLFDSALPFTATAMVALIVSMSLVL